MLVSPGTSILLLDDPDRHPSMRVLGRAG